MLAIFYLLALSLGGLALVGILRLRLSLEGRLIAGLVLGQAAGVWALYLISSMMGRMSYLAIVLTAALFLLLFLASVLRPGSRFTCLSSKANLPGEKLATEFVLLAALLAIFFTWLNLHAILPSDSQGNLYATEHVWADTPFHVSIINSFVYRDNFPPVYPILEGAPLRYPFLVDLQTAALVKGGFTLRQGIAVSNIILQVSIFLLIYLIARELGGSRRTGFLTSLIFLFLGNSGFLLAFQDMQDQGGFFSWVGHLPWGYTGSSLGVETRERLGVGLYLGNPTYLFFMPRRAVTFGVAVSLTLVLLLLRLAQRRETRVESRESGVEGYLPFMAAGMLLGLLPRIHAHSFLVMVVFAGFVVVTRPWWRLAGAGSRESRVRIQESPPLIPGQARSPAPTACNDNISFYVKTAVMAGVAVLIALPQLFIIKGQVGGSFFKLWPGWIGEAHQALASLEKPILSLTWLAQTEDAAALFLKFWLWNASLLLLILPLALWRATRNQRLFYLPFILIFILANLVKIQPWEWDNNNLFLYWQISSVLIVSLFLGSFAGQKDPSPGRVSGKARLQLIKVAAAILAIVFLTAGGLLNILRTGQEKLFLWSAQEVRLAEWVRNSTPPDSLFLTGSAHSHPVPSLGGRQIVMGFEGWLFSHGLPYEKTLEDVIRMYRGDTSLLRKHGVDYIALTPHERHFASSRGFPINDELFRNPEVFEPVYREISPQGSWEIYRVKANSKQQTANSKQ